MNDFLGMPNENVGIFVIITKQGAYYSARIIARDKESSEQSSVLMQTPTPLTRMLLEQLLESFGFHQNEVFDALDTQEDESVMIRHPLW